MPPRIQKADGTFEPFNRDKLFNSLIRTVATQGRAEEITEILEGEIR